MAMIEVLESHQAQVGPYRVQRALPQRLHRTVGAWCFADHMGPAAIDETSELVGPHPHIGLQTVTWLLSGQVVHKDSLGSEQVIHPGELNLMSAGHGISHSEEGTGFRGTLHGIQLWVAMPSATRDGPAAFEHHDDLPQLELGDATATVLVGTLGDTRSPARCDTEHVGVDLELRRGQATVPVNRGHEHALIVLDGAIAVDDAVVTPGQLAYLGADRDELRLEAHEPTRAMVLGGVPFPEQISMWWNYVARTHDEIEAANQDWLDAGERFGSIDTAMPRIAPPPIPWTPPHR